MTARTCVLSSSFERGGPIARSQSPEGPGRGRADADDTGRTTTVWERDGRLNDDPTVRLGPSSIDGPGFDESDLDAPTRRARPAAEGPTLELSPPPKEGFSGFDEVLPSVMSPSEARSMHAEPTQHLVSGVTRTLPRDTEATVPAGPPPQAPPRRMAPEAETVRTPVSGPPRSDGVPAPVPSLRRAPTPRPSMLTLETKSGLAGLAFGLLLLALLIGAVSLLRML